MKRKVGRFVYWAPRILGIAFVCFLALFSLDVFEPGLGFWEIVLGLFIHNIPAFVLAAVVIIAWRHEIVGAIAFVAAGALYIIWLLTSRRLELYMLSWFVIVAGPAFLVGILFFVSWRQKRRDKLK